MRAVMDALKRAHFVREGRHDDRRVCEVLEERLEQLPLPEFKMLAAYITGYEDFAVGACLGALTSELGEKVVDPRPENAEKAEA